MSTVFLALMAVIPIAAIFILMVGFRWPATKAMPIAFVVTFFLALVVWRTPLNYILASSLNGVVIALTIILIVFGALTLLFSLRESGALTVIKNGFTYISPDRRIQAIIIAWLFQAFVEATAGFGAPIALVSPLMLSIGFPAMGAVMVALIGNTTPVSFGTIGIPTLMGIGTSLNTPPVLDILSKHGLTFEEMMHRIGTWTAIQHSLPGILIPLLIVVVLTRFFGENKSIKEGLVVWPYALFAGLCFIVPFLITAILLGPEFPCLVGGLLGLAILIPTTRAGFLVPKKVWDFPEKSKWENYWNGSISISGQAEMKNISPLKAWTPYLLMGLLLVIGRLGSLPFNAWLKSLKFVSPPLFGTTIKPEFEPLTNPGIMPFLLVALLTIPFFGMNRKQVKIAWRDSLKGIRNPLIALAFTVPMVRIMIQTGTNPANYMSMPVALAQSMVQVFHRAWPLVDSFIGALGAFISGSNTVSNMLFSPLHFSIADNLGVSHVILVSLQNVGGALGNLINVQKVVTGCATVGLIGLEGVIIKRNLAPLLFLVILTGIIGLLLTYLIVPALF